MLALSIRFPVGVYHAQEQSGFAEPEWPPHPLRVVAALVAASRAGSSRDDDIARGIVDRLAAAGPPTIVAPALGVDSVPAALRGASRWAPRNHELPELKKGIHPREPGRGRAEVEKVGVAIGDVPVVFAWPDLSLDRDDLEAVQRLVQDITVLGTSRSPVIVTVDPAYEMPSPAAASAWRPGRSDAGVVLRVADDRSPAQYDAWHALRRAPVGRDGAPVKAPLLVVPRIGVPVRYLHDRNAPEAPNVDPGMWGDMIVLATAGDVRPMAASSLAFARATRAALLASCEAPGVPGEAPPILRGHDGAPHAAFVPLSVVGDPEHGTRANRASGRTLGIGVLLPHEDRVEDLLEQQHVLLEIIARFLDSGASVRVPGVGPVQIVRPETMAPRTTLQDARLRRSSRFWTTVTPVVASHYLRKRSRTGLAGHGGLMDQVARECAHVGLPRPLDVQERRLPRFAGAPRRALTAGLRADWKRSAEGPHLHLDLEFERPVIGPILIGRARHFGLGLCLPYAGGEAT